jgi:hypothetical protein
MAKSMSAVKSGVNIHELKLAELTTKVQEL